MVNILHQSDVEAVIDARIVTAELGDVVPGTAAVLDTGTAPGELPTNADLGGASLLEVGTIVGTVAAGDDSRFAQVATPVVSTTAALAAVGNAINTTDKVIGKQVFNSDTGIVVVATGVAAADVWNSVAGGLAHTPV